MNRDTDTSQIVFEADLTDKAQARLKKSYEIMRSYYIPLGWAGHPVKAQVDCKKPFIQALGLLGKNFLVT